MSVLIPDPTYPGNLNWKELRLLRKQTGQFIAANQSNFSLERPILEDDGQGGKIESDTPDIIDPQAFRLIAQASGRQSIERRTLDGQTVIPGYVLLGKWSANVQYGDKFLVDNKIHEVVFVHPDRRYQTTCEVAYRG